MALDLDSIRASYAAGIPTRDRLTGYSPADMKEVLDRIHQMCKGYQKMEAGEEYYPNATMRLSYGGEKSNDTPAIDFILQRATLSWGYWDTWSVELNEFGIFAKYKPEHGAEEEVFTLGWCAIGVLKTIFEIK
jgi:hypothetical protein